MDTKLATIQIRTKQWASIIQDCRSSGLKVDDYCEQHSLLRNAYYYWQRKVKEAVLSQAGFVGIQADTLKAETGLADSLSGSPFFSSDSPVCEWGLCRNQLGYTHATPFTSAGSDPPCLMTLPALNGSISVPAIPVSKKELGSPVGVKHKAIKGFSFFISFCSNFKQRARSSLSRWRAVR